MEPSKAQALIQRLREEIRRRETTAPPDRPVLPSGFAPLDSLLPGGGFPTGRVVELSGPSASGKTTLALLAIAQATRAGRLVAFVDSSGELYPPAARALEPTYRACSSSAHRTPPRPCARLRCWPAPRPLLPSSPTSRGSQAPPAP